MTQEQILEGNKLIAEFMGALDFMNSMRFGDNPEKELGRYYDYSELKYHSSWDWIMPVLKVCKEIDADTVLHDLDIDEAFLNVVEFIKEYN